MPVILMPFFAIQNSSRDLKRCVASIR